jgi:hypothetical protein
VERKQWGRGNLEILGPWLSREGKSLQWPPPPVSGQPAHDSLFATATDATNSKLMVRLVERKL